MDIAVADAALQGVEVSYEYDYGSTTELYLENLGRHGDLVGLLRPRQPWHGNRVAALAATSPTRSAWRARDRRAGGCFLQTPTPVSSYPYATGAGRRPDATSW